MGSFCSPSQNTTTTSNAPPLWQQQQQQNNIAYARDVVGANPSYIPYTQQNPLQQQAFAGLQGVASASIPYTQAGSAQGFAGFNTAANASPYYQQAAQTIGSADPYFQQAAELARGSSGPVNALQYMSPYTQSVVDTTMANSLRTDAIAQNGALGNAIKQGNAFGGDRAGVAQAELARGQSMARDQTIAGLYDQGFGRSLSAAEQDASRGAGLAGTMSGIGSAQIGAGNALAGVGNSITNQGQTLSGIGVQQAGMGSQYQNNSLAAYMAQLQGGTQGYNQDYQQFQNAAAYPYQQAQFLSNITNGQNAGGTGTSTTPGASPLSQGVGAAAAGAGFLGTTGAFGAAGWLAPMLAGLADGGRVTGYADGGLVQDTSSIPIGNGVSIPAPAMPRNANGVPDIAQQERAILQSFINEPDTAANGMAFGNASMGSAGVGGSYGFGGAVRGYATGGMPSGIPGVGPNFQGVIPLQQMSRQGGVQMPGLQAGAQAPQSGLLKQVADAAPGLKKIADQLRGSPTQLQSGVGVEPTPLGGDGSAGVDPSAGLGVMYARGGLVRGFADGGMPQDPDFAARFAAAFPGQEPTPPVPSPGLVPTPRPRPQEAIDADPIVRMPPQEAVDAWRRGVQADNGDVTTPVARGLAPPGGLPKEITGLPAEEEPSQAMAYDKPRPSAGLVPPKDPTNPAGNPYLKPPSDYAAPQTERPDPWQSLMAAGLGMMTSNSPHIMQNIGAGGIQGVANIGAQQKAIQERYDSNQRAKQLADQAQQARAQLWETTRAAKAAEEVAAQTAKRTEAREARTDAMQPLVKDAKGNWIPNPALIEYEKQKRENTSKDKIVPVPGRTTADGYQVYYNQETGEEVTGKTKTVGKESAGKPLPTASQKALGDAGAAYSSFSNLSSSWKPEFGGKVSEMLAEGQNFLGRKLDSSAYADQAQWWQNYAEEKNKVRHALFGSALTATEKTEFDKANITPGMTSAIIESNLGKQRAAAERAARKMAQGLVKSKYDPEAVEAFLGIPLDELGTKAPTLDDVLREGREAIAKGAPRAAVETEIRKKGFSPKGL